MYQWTKQSGSHRSSLASRPLPSLSPSLSRVRAWTHLNSRPAVFQRGKNSIVTHRNIPRILSCSRSGEGRGAPFFLPSRGSVSMGVARGWGRKSMWSERKGGRTYRDNAKTGEEDESGGEWRGEGGIRERDEARCKREKRKVRRVAEGERGRARETLKRRLNRIEKNGTRRVAEKYAEE